MKKSYIIIILVILFFIILNSLGLKIVGKGYTNTKIDSIEVVKYLPSKTNTFFRDSIKEVYITKYKDTSGYYERKFKELKDKYSEETNNNKILRDLLQATRKREYKETFKDSVLDAEIIAYTSGKLDSLKFSYQTKEQRTSHFEKTTTNTIQPRFRIYGGINTSFSRSFDNIDIGVSLGLQTKKGNIYKIQASNNQYSAGMYIPLFTRY